MRPSKREIMEQALELAQSLRGAAAAVRELASRLAWLESYTKRNIAQIAMHDANYDNKVDELLLKSKSTVAKRTRIKK